MAVETFNARNLPEPPPIYSHGAKAGPLTFTAGIVAIDERGETVGRGDAAKQTRFVLDSIGKILSASGASFHDVAVAHVFIKSLEDYKAVNAVYAEFFPINPPPRYCVRADLVKDEWLVEIAVIANTAK